MFPSYCGKHILLATAAIIYHRHGEANAEEDAMLSHICYMPAFTSGSPPRTPPGLPPPLTLGSITIVQKLDYFSKENVAMFDKLIEQLEAEENHLRKLRGFGAKLYCTKK